MRLCLKHNAQNVATRIATPMRKPWQMAKRIKIVVPRVGKKVLFDSPIFSAKRLYPSIQNVVLNDQDL